MILVSTPSRSATVVWNWRRDEYFSELSIVQKEETDATCIFTIRTRLASYLDSV